MLLKNVQYRLGIAISACLALAAFLPLTMSAQVMNSTAASFPTVSPETAAIRKPGRLQGSSFSGTRRFRNENEYGTVEAQFCFQKYRERDPCHR